MKLLKFIFIPLIAILVGAGYVAYGTAHSRLESHMQKTLQAHGFPGVTVGDIAFAQNHVIYSDIKLDADKFSFIDAVRVYGTWKDLLLSTRHRAVVVDGLNLTGSYDKESGLVISGWNKNPFTLPTFEQMLLNGGQLDLNTSEGALRFQAKSRAQRENDGKLKWQAAVWGVQHQLKIETNWNGTINADGTWIADVEFENGGLNLEKLQASRMAGWLIIDRTKAVLPDISGQIDAGKMAFGDVSFGNFRMTVDGLFNDLKIIARGEVAGYEGMLASLDLSGAGSSTPQVRATVETASLDDMMAFLTALQNSDTEAGTLASLLLTPGNLGRVRSQVDKLPYDTLELEVFGPLYDLAGKIILKTFKDGVTQRHVISMDPGENG